MEVLHAPWRIQYILAKKGRDCEGSLFANIGQSSEDERNHVVARQRHAYAVLNTYPYNPGHILVVPYRQVVDLVDLGNDEMLDLMNLVRRCQRALADTMSPQGVNIGINIGAAAGAGIQEHLHVHIVPRWKGDTNFMPVTAEARVLSEALDETASKLRDALAAQPS